MKGEIDNLSYLEHALGAALRGQGKGDRRSRLWDCQLEEDAERQRVGTGKGGHESLPSH